VEQGTGYLVAFYLSDRKDRIFNRATADAFKEIPTSIKKSFTVDNGKEFTTTRSLLSKPICPYIFATHIHLGNEEQTKTPTVYFASFPPKGHL